MAHLAHSIACHAYGLSGLLYLTYLVRKGQALAVAARVSALLGLLVHAAGLSTWVIGQRGIFLGLSQGCSALAFLLVAICLVVDLRYQEPVLGAFLVPFALAVLIPGILWASGASALPPGIAQPLLPFHIGVALLGLAASACACGVGALYLLMDRQMRGKRFGLLFSRLPSLQILDRVHHRLIVWGFAALSITLVTGALFLGRGSVPTLGPKVVFTVVGWGVLGLLVAARFFAGFRGSRAALLSMAGFAVLVVSFLSSFEGIARF